MTITVFYRYDTNGAWTHDIEIKLGEQKTDPKSMWRAVEVIDIKELRESAEVLEMALEELVEQNRKLLVRVRELGK